MHAPTEGFQLQTITFHRSRRPTHLTVDLVWFKVPSGRNSESEEWVFRWKVWQLANVT